MASKNIYQRRASPNEQRTITREDLGHYYAVIVGAVYEVKGDFNIETPESFYPALSQCAQQQPWLCVVVGDAHTNKSFFERVSTLDMQDHVTIRSPPQKNKDDLSLIQETLEVHVDRPFKKDCPPWRILVQPLTAENQFFVAFSFSHTIGDGITGPIFHKTFARGLTGARAESNPEKYRIVESSPTSLPEPFDTPERLPISWSFLLGPLLGELLPKFVLKFLGLKTSITSTDEGTWLATSTFFNPETFKTQVRAVEIESAVVERALHTSRSNDAKLTGVIQHLIARALSKSLPDERVTNFVSQVAVNMRKSVGIPADEMGEFVSGGYVTVERFKSTGPLTAEEWTQARETTHKLALIASQLQDHAIALLRYAPDIRQWMVNKVGQKRDSSFEMSNLGSVDVDAVTSTDVAIKKMIFTQPGHVAGPPIAFNFASVKGGSLTFTVSWQTGALGIEGDEGKFVDEVCATLKSGFESLK